jgi:hypothetical protein
MVSTFSNFKAGIISRSLTDTCKSGIWAFQSIPSPRTEWNSVDFTSCGVDVNTDFEWALTRKSRTSLPWIHTHLDSCHDWGCEVFTWTSGSALASNILLVKHNNHMAASTCQSYGTRAGCKYDLWFIRWGKTNCDKTKHNLCQFCIK